MPESPIRHARAYDVYKSIVEAENQTGMQPVALWVSSIQWLCRCLDVSVKDPIKTIWGLPVKEFSPDFLTTYGHLITGRYLIEFSDGSYWEYPLHGD